MMDIGGKISEAWQAISEEKKAEYNEVSNREKEKWSVEFAKFTQTRVYKDFKDSQATLECKQKLLKLQRVKLDEAPKRALSAYALYREEVMPKIAEENKGSSCGDLARKCAAAWAEVSDEDKAKYAERAAKLKETYEEELAEFKAKTN